MKHTKRPGSSLYTASAVGWLQEAQEHREDREAYLEGVRVLYANVKSFEGYPGHVRARLESLRVRIAVAVGKAEECWRLAGRLPHTLARIDRQIQREAERQREWIRRTEQHKQTHTPHTQGD